MDKVEIYIDGRGHITLASGRHVATYSDMLAYEVCLRDCLESGEPCEHFRRLYGEAICNEETVKEGLTDAERVAYFTNAGLFSIA